MSFVLNLSEQNRKMSYILFEFKLKFSILQFI